MNKRRAKKLSPSDLVEFSDGVRGLVRETNQHAVKIDWADGQKGCWIDHEDMAEIKFVQAGCSQPNPE